MLLSKVNVGWALTGAFYTIEPIIEKISELVIIGANVIPIMSFNAYNVNTRVSKSADLVSKIEQITQNKVINTFVEAERIAAKKLVDIFIVAPCTGNTIAKLANGIIDTPVLLAAKSCLRNDNSIVIGVSTNDGLSSNAMNIGKLLNTKNMFFVPIMQDNPITKPNSITFDKNYIIKTAEMALEKQQIQPLLL